MRLQLINPYFLREHMAWLSGVFTACMETSGIHYLKCAVRSVFSHHSKDVPLWMQKQSEFKVHQLLLANVRSNDEQLNDL